MCNPDKRVPCTPINTSAAIKGSQPRLRALTFYESLPPHHKTFRVRDDASTPHLKPGEFAVIDTRDTELQKARFISFSTKAGGATSFRSIPVGSGRSAAVSSSFGGLAI
jgi:hypothetical protein